MSANTPGGYLGQGPLPKDWRPEPKVQPLPKSWKEGDPLPQGTFSQPGYTPEQQAQIEWAQTRPGEEIVYPVQDRLRDSQRRSDVAWGASNLVLDKGAQLAADDPSIAGAIRGKAAEYAMSHGMDAQRANNEWEKDRTRLDAIRTDPNGAELYERYKQGQVPGYQITSNPNVSPYWKKLVAEEPIGPDPSRYGRAQMEGSSSRVGMAPTTLQSEAMGQMTRYANRLAEGRGGGAIREAMAMYQAAVMSGDEAAVTAAEAQLGTLLDPMFSKFQGRFDKEAGGSANLKQQFMQGLRAKVGVGMAGMSPEGMARSPGAVQQLQKGGTPGAPAVRNQSQPTAPRKPRVTPDGLRIHEFDSVEQLTKSMRDGSANVRGGEMVVVGGVPMTAVPSVNRYGEPEMAMVEATLFGSVPVPDPGEFADQADWGASLSDNQRQAMLDQLATDPQMRSALDRGTLETLDKVRRSRQGLLSQRMRPADRDASLATLRDQEDAALYAAVVGGVGQRARSRAITSISAADAADMARQDEKTAMTNERGRTKQGLDKILESAPMHAEAFGDDADTGEEGPQPDRFVVNTWNSMGSSERGVINDMLMVAADIGLMDEEGNAIEGGEHLPLRDLRRLVRMAGQGADEMQLAAVIEASKPGFVKEYFGGNVQLTSKISDGYSKWGKQYERWANKKSGEGQIDPSEARPWLMQQHSWMLIQHRLGMLSPAEAEYFEGLPSAVQLDPEQYATHVLSARENAAGTSAPAASGEAPAAAEARPVRGTEGIPQDRPMTLLEQKVYFDNREDIVSANAIAEKWGSMTKAERQQHLSEVRGQQAEWAAASPPPPPPAPPPPPQESEIVRRMEDRRTGRTPATPSGMPYGGGQSLVGNNPKF
jgi:hypothetical protein